MPLYTRARVRELMLIDPERIDQLYAAPDAEDLEARRDGWFPPSDDEIKEALDLLGSASPIEADILDLSLRGKSQRVIAIVLAPEGTVPITQSAISYRLDRAVDRLRYLRWLRTLDLDEERVRDVFFVSGWTPKAAGVIASLWTTHSTMETGRRLFDATKPAASQGHAYRYYHRARQWAEGQDEGDDDRARVGRWLRGYRAQMLNDPSPGGIRSTQWRERIRAGRAKRPAEEIFEGRLESRRAGSLRG